MQPRPDTILFLIATTGRSTWNILRAWIALTKFPKMNHLWHLRKDSRSHITESQQGDDCAAKTLSVVPICWIQRERTASFASQTVEKWLRNFTPRTTHRFEKCHSSFPLKSWHLGKGDTHLTHEWKLVLMPLLSEPGTQAHHRPRLAPESRASTSPSPGLPSPSQ